MAATTRSFLYLLFSMACALLLLSFIGLGSFGWTLLVASLVMLERLGISSIYSLFPGKRSPSSASEPPSPIINQKQRSRPRPRGLDLTLAARRLSQLQAYTTTQTPTLFSIKTPCDASTFYDDHVLISHTVNVSNNTVVPTPIRATRVKVLEEMMEGQLGPLPEGWEMRLSSNMRVFFFDERNGRTTWQDPRLPVECVRSDGDETPTMESNRERVKQWLATEERKKRAREARMNTLRRHIRMAKLQKISQPLGVL